MTTQATASPEMAALFEGYERQMRELGYHPDTIRFRRRRLDSFAAALGEREVSTITRAEVEAWLESLPAEARFRKDHRIAVRAFLTFCLESGHLDKATDPRPIAPGEIQRKIDSRWIDALGAFEIAERSKGRAPETIRRRVRDVRLFSTAVDTGPFQVASEDVAGWLENFDGFHRRTGCRDAVRAFYRWALRSGRTQTDPTDEPSHRGTPLAIPDAWEEPLESYRRALQSSGYPNTTIKMRISHMRRFARENPSLQLTDVNLDDLMEWMGGKRWSLESRRSMYASLRSFFAWAKQSKRAPRNPAKRLPRARGAVHRPRPASDDQVSTALANADEREALAIRLAAELGLRAGEIALVHTADVIRAGGGAALVVHGKGGKERTLPLSDSLRIALERRAGGYVFPGRVEGHISPAYIAKQVRKHLPAGVTTHALRHAFATNTYAVNNNLFAVQQLLGHARATTTQGYVEVAESSLRELVEAVAR